MWFSEAQQWVTPHKAPPGRCLPDGHCPRAHKSFLHITAQHWGKGLLGDYPEDEHRKYALHGVADT